MYLALSKCDKNDQLQASLCGVFIFSTLSIMTHHDVSGHVYASHTLHTLCIKLKSRSVETQAYILWDIDMLPSFIEYTFIVCGHLTKDCISTYNQSPLIDIYELTRLWLRAWCVQSLKIGATRHRRRKLIFLAQLRRSPSLHHQLLGVISYIYIWNNYV